ncbi:Short-chain-enoyl-CoA hydratase [Sporomusa silvacetica DSM 10669]|uniref:Short-chain-enoyl-CoA hydratase n=1 Tax=Sporomusa silvacetica DSM 10669 TaxID=1123289 RepID=A0ABZ3IL95_9FIRM|nr:enoyl-CoA hydratase-related protein [Sporomusa silvacetica]OZC13452.1 putative enoyl-CoA hydratase [Sporomusa silvacetica DSM 10669]
MQNSKVLLKVKNKIATVILNNPPVNSIDQQVVDDIENVFATLKNEDIRAVIIASENPKAFIAGGDINQFVAWNREAGVQATQRGNDVFLKIDNFPCPVICAIDGFVFGGGMELALACDIRVMAVNVKLGFPETTLGIYPGYGGTQRLPRLIGTGMAKKLIFSGERINAEEAYRIGICEHLSEEGRALEDAMQIALKIAQAGPVAVRTVKKIINQGISMNLKDAIELETANFGDICETYDKTEGAKAFLEKRQPVFKGE